MLGVDGLHVTHGRYLDNEEYGVFPRCSRDGLVDHNSGGGGEDATTYVGVDDDVTVEGNPLTNAEIGIELENILHSVVRNNVVAGNDTGGAALVENPFGFGPPDDNVVRNNVILQNGKQLDFRSPGSGDILYDGTGSRNCFANNVLKTDFPGRDHQPVPLPVSARARI